MAYGARGVLFGEVGSCRGLRWYGRSGKLGRFVLKLKADAERGIDLLHRRCAEPPVDLSESQLIDSAYLAAQNNAVFREAALSRWDRYVYGVGPFDVLLMFSAPVMTATIVVGAFLFPISFWITTQGLCLRCSCPIRTHLPGITDCQRPRGQTLLKFADSTRRSHGSLRQVHALVCAAPDDAGVHGRRHG